MITEYFKHYIDGLDGLAWWKDKNLVYTYANELTAKVFGFNSISELIGKSNEDIPQWSRGYVGTSKIDETLILALQIPFKSFDVISSNSTLIYTLVNKYPIYSPDEELLGIFCTGRILDNSEVLTQVFASLVGQPLESLRPGAYLIDGDEMSIESLIRSMTETADVSALISQIYALKKNKIVTGPQRLSEEKVKIISELRKLRQLAQESYNHKIQKKIESALSQFKM